MIFEDLYRASAEKARAMYRLARICGTPADPVVVIKALDSEHPRDFNAAMKKVEAEDQGGMACLVSVQSRRAVCHDLERLAPAASEHLAHGPDPTQVLTYVVMTREGLNILREPVP